MSSNSEASKPKPVASGTPWTKSKKRVNDRVESGPSKRVRSSPVDDRTPQCSTKSSSEAAKQPTPESEPETTRHSAAQTIKPKSTSSSGNVTLRETTGDLFDAPPNTLLLHACNTEGSWGAGIALAFRKHYPSAFALYAAHCKKWSSSLLRSCFLIPPQTKSSSEAEREAQHWIGCLFTSAKKGKAKGSVESILEATGEAVEDCLRKLGELGKEEGEVGEMRMCKINSGLFRVPWERSREVIEGVEVEGEWKGEVLVVSPE